MQKRVLYCLLMYLAGSFSGSIHAQQTLVLGTSTVPPFHNENRTGFYDRLVHEAFERVGIRLEIVDVPAERGLLNANAGIDDGDLSRIGGLEQLYPNLRPVPEKIFDQEYVAISRTVDIRTDDWSRLNNYAVAYVKGWKIFENNRYHSSDLVTVEDPPALMSLLKRNRADIVLIDRWMGLAEARRQGIEDLRVLEPPLARHNIFVYLHKKHEGLLPKIADALREMKVDGTYRRLYDQLLADFEN